MRVMKYELAFRLNVIACWSFNASVRYNPPQSGVATVTLRPSTSVCLMLMWVN